MSSLRNAQKSHQKQYKERGQLSNRKHLGNLEKHKDYVARARDYHKKEKQLKILQRKARDKNPDEFYFKMVNQRTKDGVHTIKNSESYTADQLKLMKTQDLNYVNLKRSVERKKIEKLRSELHFTDDVNNHSGKHTIFVDTEKEAKEFEASQRLQPTPDDLETAERKGDKKRPEIIKKKKRRGYKELEQRLDREKMLSKTRLGMELQRKLMGKGRKQKLEVDGTTVYKWKKQRKR
eukprot:Seg123.2 transcript_id=Seg123.2/GoldUCD/mRNA.D3Y31 product="putative U3 small nucleolar RNA-associated protein 11" protein_id=Seg123.2/GoldUCD/D3Y31